MASVALDQKNVSVRIKMLTLSDGSNATGITAASAGHLIWYQHGVNVARVTDSTSAADLAAITSDHSDWGLFEVGSGVYRVDLPDAAFASGKGDVMIGMETTAETSVPITVTIEPLFKFQGLASAVTATTTTFAAGPVPYKGDVIYVVAGTGISQSRVITSVASQVATHVAWDTNISASASTILLIAGDAYQANTDVVSSTLSTLSASDLATSHTDYNVKGLLPGTLSDAGNMNVNVTEVNDIEVTGAGTTGNDWGPV